MKAPLINSLWVALLIMATQVLHATLPLKASDGRAIRVACVGDSITQGTGAGPGMSYPSQLQILLGDGWRVGNFGVSGRTLLKNGDFPYWNEGAFKQAQDFKPDAVIIMLGTNDTKPQNWAHQDEFYTDYQELVKIFKNLPNKPRVYICRPCPVPEPGNFGINESNIQTEILLVDKLAREEELEVIDMHAALVPHPEFLTDRVHPTNQGARLMAEAACQSLTGEAAPASAIPTVKALGLSSPFAKKKVLWLGDSITQDGTYVSFLEYLLRRAYPQDSFDIVSIGLASETVSGLSEKTHPFPRPCVLERLGRALEKVKPDLVVACYGMNDGIYHPQSKERMHAFQEGMENLITKVKAVGAEVILLTPPPFDAEVVKGRCRPKSADDFAYNAPYVDYDQVLMDYGRWELGLNGPGVKVIDLHGPVQSYLEKKRLEQPDFRLSGDGIHPGAEGHLVMAAAILDAFGVQVNEKNWALAALDIQNDKLYDLVRQRRELRSKGWLDFVGYTRDKTVQADTIEPVEIKVGELSKAIEALSRP